MAFFPTPVWRSEWECAEELSRMETAVRRLMEEDPEGEQKSNRGGWHSQYGVLRSAPFAKLAELITRQVHRINPRAKVNRGWANVNPPGTVNAVHIHPKSILSGVFYVAAPEDSGNLRLHDPRPAALMTGDLPDYVSSPVEIPPKPGMLLLFPAWLPHEVLENRSQEDRISIAFNVHD